MESKDYENVRESLNTLKEFLSKDNIETLLMHSQALLNKFAPIKEGGRAKIIKKIECKGGWRGSEETLKIGAEGEIVKVYYQNNKYYFDFMTDDQWYLDHGKVFQRTVQRYLYYLSEKYLEAI